MEYNEVHEALYLTTLGREVVECTIRLGWDQFQTGMDSIAMQVLERIYAIVQDDSLNDSECFMKIDSIISVFFDYLELRTDRHQEYE